MIEDIKREVSELPRPEIINELMLEQNKEGIPIINYNEVIEILDKYQDQDIKKKKQILFIGSRSQRKSIIQAENIVNYIKENNLTECTIYVEELPDVYKDLYKELKQFIQQTKIDLKSEYDEHHYENEDLADEHLCGRLYIANSMSTKWQELEKEFGIEGDK